VAGRFFFQRAREGGREAEGGAAPRASLYLKGLMANRSRLLKGDAEPSQRAQRPKPRGRRGSWRAVPDIRLQPKFLTVLASLNASQASRGGGEQWRSSSSRARDIPTRGPCSKAGAAWRLTHRGGSGPDLVAGGGGGAGTRGLPALGAGRAG